MTQSLLKAMLLDLKLAKSSKQTASALCLRGAYAQAQLKREEDDMRDPNHIAQFAKNRLGTTQTEEHKAKKNAAQRAVKALFTAERIAEIRAQRAVTCETTVVIGKVEYLSLIHAEEMLGITRYKLKKHLDMQRHIEALQNVKNGSMVAGPTVKE